MYDERNKSMLFDKPLTPFQAMSYIVIAKVILSFVLGLQLRYKEQEWFKKVFFKQDGVLAAVFTEKQ